MKYLSVFIVSTYLICGFGLSFSKLVMFSFEEKIERSDIIIHGRVNKINRNIFSENMSIVDVDHVVAGELRDKRVKIKFGRKNIFFAKEDLSVLKANCEYIFFLKYNEGVYSIVGAHEGYFEIQNNMVCVDNKYIELNNFFDEIGAIRKKKKMEP